MSHHTGLWQRLGRAHPIIQAPMVGVSTPALAAAVTEAGALGSLGLGGGDASAGQEMLRAARSLTRGPINANVFCHVPAVPDPAREAAWSAWLAPHFDSLGASAPAVLSEPYRSFLADESMLQMLLDERPGVVSFHFGLPPAHWVDALRRAGQLTLACVTTPEEAAQAVSAGVDVLVAQGIEAGGHRGVFDPAQERGLTTVALVRLLASQGPLPVVAAGGIMDGAGIAAMRRLGAAGVQMGTAFILCPESAADAAYRAALSSPATADTRITPALSGRPARGLPNRLMAAVDQPGGPPLPDYPIAYSAAKALQAAAKARAETGYAPWWAGQGAPLARALPAAELVACLVQESREPVSDGR